MAFKVLFINDNGINESLPTTEISAVLKTAGFETDLLIQKDEGKNFFGKISAIKPDAFVIPFDVMGQSWSIGITNELKKRWREIPIVAVGTYATLFPEVLLQCDADVLCRGEAEYALLELFERMRDGKDFSDVKGLWIKRDGEIIKNSLRPLIANLDELPIPDRELYYKRYEYLRKFSTKRIVAGRGCAQRCFYCYNPALQDLYECRGKRFTRKKSPERVLVDIEDLKKRAVLKSIYFIDDLFTDDKSWLLKFCEIYPKKFAIPFACNITADSVDEDKVRALKDAGCRAVLMGVETGNENLRMQVLNKVVKDEQIVEAASLFKKYRIKFLTYNMLGLPTENLDSLLKTVEFNQKLKPDYIRVTVAFPMPNTKLTEIAVEKGLVTRERLNYIFSLSPKEQYTTSIYQSDKKFMKKVKRLYHLFPFAVKFRLPRWKIKFLISVPLFSFILKWLHYFTVLWEEKGVFNITLISGLRFFLHTGHPLNKTKNANNFVP